MVPHMLEGDNTATRIDDMTKQYMTGDDTTGCK